MDAARGALTEVNDPGRKPGRAPSYLRGAMLFWFGLALACLHERESPHQRNGGVRVDLEAAQPSVEGVLRLGTELGEPDERIGKDPLRVQLGVELWGLGLLDEARSVLEPLVQVGLESHREAVTTARLLMAEIDLQQGRFEVAADALVELGSLTGKEGKLPEDLHERLEIASARVRLARLGSVAAAQHLEALLEQTEDRVGSQLWTRVVRLDLVRFWTSRGRCDQARRFELDTSSTAFDGDARPGSGVAWRLARLVSGASCLDRVELEEAWVDLEGEMALARGFFAISRPLVKIARLEVQWRQPDGDANEVARLGASTVIEEVRAALGDEHRWLWRVELVLLRWLERGLDESSGPGREELTAEIERGARQLLARAERTPGSNDPLVVDTRLLLVRALERDARWREAADVLRSGRVRLDEEGGGFGARALEVELRRGRALLALGEAEEVWSRLSVLAIRLIELEADPARVRGVKTVASMALIDLERFAEAERRLLDEMVAAEAEARTLDLELTHARLTHLYQRWGQEQSAARHWGFVSARLRDELERDGLALLAAPF